MMVMATVGAPPHQSNQPSLARAMVWSARSIQLSDLSGAATDKLKICLLDYLACALEARDLPWSRQAIATVSRATTGACILSSDITASVADAAFANATLGHGLVREDMHAGSLSHHGVVIWPVLLALAQGNVVSGARLRDFAGPFARTLQAKMSIQYSVAVALVRRSIDEDSFRRLDDPSVERLARMIRLTGDREFTAAFPAAQGAEVEVSLAVGASISRRIPDVIAATEGEIRHRFRTAAGAVLGDERADAIAQAIDRLERADNAGRIAALCAVPRRGGKSRAMASRSAARGG
jgi:2-methylcitrate dehydratase PrpD